MRKGIMPAVLLFTIVGVLAFGNELPLQASSTDQKMDAAVPGAGSHKPLIWQDPGSVEELDFASGPGGISNTPQPPFTFVEEDLKGSNPKIKVTDANGNLWTIKFGPEAHAEVFATRMAWAVGYFVEPNYFVTSGRVTGVKKLARARQYIGRDGSFTNGRFELRQKEDQDRLRKEVSWKWNKNPFVGTKEFNGLKIITMLVSNFDDKDARDAARGSNTAVFLHSKPDGTIEERYAVVDWGGSMGKWGGYFSRHRWDCTEYARQTSEFTRGVKSGYVRWGWSGQHTRDITDKISAGDVNWLLQYLGRITDNQLRAGLRASGATPEEVECFAKAVRERIGKLQQIAAETRGEEGQSTNHFPVSLKTISTMYP